MPKVTQLGMSSGGIRIQCHWIPSASKLTFLPSMSLLAPTSLTHHFSGVFCLCRQRQQCADLHIFSSAHQSLAEFSEFSLFPYLETLPVYAQGKEIRAVSRLPITQRFVFLFHRVYHPDSDPPHFLVFHLRFVIEQ